MQNEVFEQVFEEVMGRLQANVDKMGGKNEETR